MLLVRTLTDHPLVTQFTGDEFWVRIEQTGMKVVKWRQMGNWLVIGQAVKGGVSCFELPVEMLGNTYINAAGVLQKKTNVL